MELKEKIFETKAMVVDRLATWVDGRVEQLLSGNPKAKVAGKYIRRGVSNMMSREDERINGWIEDVLLFIADENGKFDFDEAFDDMMGIFKSMPEKKFDAGIIRGSVGNGILRFELPDNLLVSMFLGDVGAIKLTEADFLELKDLLTAS